MSALAKPLTHSTKTIGGDSDPINVEHILTVTPVTADNDVVNTTDKFLLIIALQGHGQHPKNVTWRYPNAVDRDADLASILANNSVALA